MTKPQVLDGDVVREMTDAEFHQYELDLATMKTKQLLMIEAEAVRASAVAKLAALGLTDNEIKALVG